MRWFSPIRRRVKWCGLVVSLLIVVMWPVSFFVHAVLHGSSSWLASIFGGAFSVRWGGGFTAGTWVRVGPTHGARFFWPGWLPSVRQQGLLGTTPVLWKELNIPLILPLLIAAIPTAVLWWTDRRRIPPGHCQKCGYDLTGNVSGICPECGEKI